MSVYSPVVVIEGSFSMYALTSIVWVDPASRVPPGMRICEPVARVVEPSFHVNIKGLFSTGQEENVPTTLTNAASLRNMESVGGINCSMGAGDPFFKTLKTTSTLSEPRKFFAITAISYVLSRTFISGVPDARNTKLPDMVLRNWSRSSSFLQLHANISALGLSASASSSNSEQGSIELLPKTETTGATANSGADTAFSASEPEL
jgi:hypothetical protein